MELIHGGRIQNYQILILLQNLTQKVGRFKKEDSEGKTTKKSSQTFTHTNGTETVLILKAGERPII